MTEEEILNIIRRYGLRLFGIIQTQVPQPGGPREGRQANPYATGRLKNSLRWSVNKDNTISFRFFRYGIFTDKGAGSEKISAFNPFEQNWTGYQKANNPFSIKAQYWTGLATPEAQNALRMFNEELAREYEIQLETTTTRNLANL